MHKINTKRLENELLIKRNVEDNFLKFRKNINPTLLFESLEALIVLIGKNKEKTDDFLDALSQVYRYILSKKNQELIHVNEETNVVEYLSRLFDYLPYRNVSIQNKLTSDFYVVPNSILFIVEQVIRSTIRSDKVDLEIELYEEGSLFFIKYVPKNKINDAFDLEKLVDLEHIYSIYNSDSVTIFKEHNFSIISLPKLLLNPTYESSTN